MNYFYKVTKFSLNHLFEGESRYVKGLILLMIKEILQILIKILNTAIFQSFSKASPSKSIIF